MKLRICGLAFILLGFLNSVGSAETPIERDSYLVNTIGAFGNCHARDTVATRTTQLAHGFGQIPATVSRNLTPIPSRPGSSDGHYSAVDVREGGAWKVQQLSEVADEP
jgi:hypothetical protein